MTNLWRSSRADFSSPPLPSEFYRRILQVGVQIVFCASCLSSPILNGLVRQLFLNPAQVLFDRLPSHGCRGLSQARRNLPKLAMKVWGRLAQLRGRHFHFPLPLPFIFFICPGGPP